LFAFFVALLGKTVERYGKCCVSHVTSVPYAQWCLLSVQDITSMQHRSVPNTNILLHNFPPSYLPFPASLFSKAQPRFSILSPLSTGRFLHNFLRTHKPVNALPHDAQFSLTHTKTTCDCGQWRTQEFCSRRTPPPPASNKIQLRTERMGIWGRFWRQL